jgi:hypothetical protein
VLRQLLIAVARALAEQAPPKSDPEGIRHIKQLAEQLNEKATQFRAVVARAVLLKERVELLEQDSRQWEERARIATEKGSLELQTDVARICGRIEGRLQEARAELAQRDSDEAHLRNLLTLERKRFADLVEWARRLGHDVSGCLLYIDLSRPERVPDTDLLTDDEGRDFVARVIDSAGVH